MNSHLRLLGVSLAAMGLALLAVSLFVVRPRLVLKPIILTPPTPTAASNAEPDTPVVAQLDLNIPEAAPAGAEVADAGRPPPLELGTGTLGWELQLAQAAKADGKAARARAVVALLPGLPEEALPTAAEQLVDRLPDADYNGIVRPVVANAKTHGQVLSVLFADLMERPDAITLPTLLGIARDSAHPFAPAARDNLQLLLGNDFGHDWPRWEKEIQRKLSVGNQAGQ